jgi:hypothetical protein
MLAFKAATGKAFTIFLAGFAFTIVTFPKISLFPALVAGFVRVLSLHTPGIVNTPVAFTSLAATAARLLRIFAQTVFLSSHSVAKASAMAPLVMVFAFAADFTGAIFTDEVGIALRRPSNVALEPNKYSTVEHQREVAKERRHTEGEAIGKLKGRGNGEEEGRS